MKTIRAILLLFFIPLLVFFGACGEKSDLLAPFRGAYCADLAGELRGVAFGAVLEADTPREDGARTLTLTFYAPASLSGTVVKSAADGTLSVTAGSVTVEGVHADGFLPLLTLLPVGGDIEAIETDGAGHSVVTGEGFTLTLTRDGMPIAVKTAEVSATIVRFELLSPP